MSSSSTTFDAVPRRAQPKSASAPVSLSLFALSTFCQRLGIWLYGFPFPLVLLLSPVIIAKGVIAGRMKVSLVRALLFTLLILSFATSFALGRAEWISVQSCLLLVGMYVPWILYTPVKPDEYAAYIRRVAFWVSVFAILTVVQYAGQYVARGELWFSWRSLIPTDFLIEYNTLNEMHYGSGTYKGNGMFLLEPSTVSGLIARVFLLTVVVLGDLKYAVPFAAGLLAAFSGTGLVFTGVFTVPAIVQLLGRSYISLPKVYLLIVFLCFLAVLVFGTFVGDYLMGRTAEFSNPRASGYARFTSTLILFELYLTQDLGTFLVGYGPGSFKHIASNITDEAFCSGWIKLCMEYGFFGLVSFSWFFAYCVYTSTRSKLITLGLLAQYLILDGPLIVPQLAFLSYAIFVLPVRVLPKVDKSSSPHLAR